MKLFLEIERVKSESQKNLILNGKTHSERVKNAPEKSNLEDVEFSIFSQWGEDGIIQYLIDKVEIKNKTFIEFGVENYTESNTRFLLMNNNWQGFVMDGSKENIDFIHSDNISWRYDLQAEAAFINKENINNLLKKSGFDPDVGILSIDIDGNDFWVWENIDALNPRIVIAEYNSLFGLAPVSIPYREDFSRTKSHFSNLYYGASLTALCHLAKRKGYVFAGSNTAGNNSFFVRKDVSSNIKEVTPEDGYVLSKFRESRNLNGKLTFLRGNEREKLISDMPVINVVTGKKSTLGDALKALTSES